MRFMSLPQAITRGSEVEMQGGHIRPICAEVTHKKKKIMDTIWQQCLNNKKKSV